MISLRRVSKRYGDLPPAVSELSLEIEDGELCILLGPSGCGKTTTLKMINRLIEPSSGEIFVDGNEVSTLDPVALRRGIGYVMQQGGLFPHQRVGDNVATVPRLLRWPKPKVRTRVAELLDLVGLDPDRYERRWPHELSGGERQRVGVARALGGDPPVLLMDEPFGAVDPIARKRLQEEFGELQRRLGKTVVLVTHDIEEAVALGSRIALLSPGGRLEQYGTPAEVLSRPASAFVSEFVGAERGLHRLEVTKVGIEHLTRAPRVHPEDALAATDAELHRTGYRFGLVADRAGELVGFVPRDASSPDVGGPASAGSGGDGPDGATVEGRVADRQRPFQAAVPLGSTLQQALASMLGHDDGFVAVTDGGRVVGVLTPDDLYAAIRGASPSTKRPPQPAASGAGGSP